MADAADGRVLTDLLFGEVSIESLIEGQTTPERREALERVRIALAAHDDASVRSGAETLLADAQLSSREAIWLWGLWRQAGGSVSPGIGRRVLGVVIEVGMPSGVDFLGAYADHTARYYNFSGAGVVWEASDRKIDQLIDALLDSASRVVPYIGPWQGPRRPPPSGDVIRLNMLTPAGLHIGEGDSRSMSSDRMAGPVLKAGTNLMKRLTELGGRH